MSESQVALTQESLDGARGAGAGTHVPAPVSRKARRPRASWRERLEITLLAGPAIVVFVAFVIVPVVMAVYYGFYRWTGDGPPTDWVGLQNYKLIFQDPVFFSAVKHSFAIVGLSLVIQGPLAVGLALLLNRKIRGRSIIRVLVFAPWVVSEVVAGMGWNEMLQADGALNHMLTGLHIFGTVSIDWIGDSHVAIWTLMMVLTWKYLGFAIILMMAGLQNIPEELFEAARVDGASYWQAQRYVTVPLLGPTIRIWAFLSIIGSLQLFDLVWVIWGSTSSQVAGTSTMAMYMRDNGLGSGTWGYGSAVAVVLFGISLVVAVAYQRFVLRRDLSGAITEGA
ncbi:MAG: sugar ABC transporter permease [Nocardioidaceae bacterium]|nr:sugar ABC transporter permease [Nocardioidaceae bacterium]MCL2613310.1 sugar ABC transporter permease [Nocardioidaceae bacterium]